MADIPNYVKKYLWDVDTNTISADSHAQFVIERVLEYGDIDSLKWLTEVYPTETISSTLKVSKKISAKTGNFYSLIFNIPKEEMECIRKPFTQKQNRF